MSDLIEKIERRAKIDGFISGIFAGFVLGVAIVKMFP